MIARETDRICDERFHVSRHMSYKVYKMFLNKYQDFEPVHCKKPCTQTKYEIEKTAELTEDDYLVIKLTFKPFVYVTRSAYSISVIDTITSLGGSVSNCKTPSPFFVSTAEILSIFLVSVLLRSHGPNIFPLHQISWILRRSTIFSVPIFFPFSCLFFFSFIDKIFPWSNNSFTLCTWSSWSLLTKSVF